MHHIRDTAGLARPFSLGLAGIGGLNNAFGYMENNIELY